MCHAAPFRLWVAGDLSQHHEGCRLWRAAARRRLLRRLARERCWVVGVDTRRPEAPCDVGDRHDAGLDLGCWQRDKDLRGYRPVPLLSFHRQTATPHNRLKGPKTARSSSWVMWLVFGGGMRSSTELALASKMRSRHWCALKPSNFSTTGVATLRKSAVQARKSSNKP